MSEEQIASCLLCQSTFSNHEELFVHSCEQIKVETNELEDKKHSAFFEQEDIQDISDSDSKKKKKRKCNSKKKRIKNEIDHNKLPAKLPVLVDRKKVGRPKRKQAIKEENEYFLDQNQIDLNASAYLELSEEYIASILQQVDELCENIKNGDPDIERTLEINNNLNNAVSCYRNKLIDIKFDDQENYNQDEIQAGGELDISELYEIDTKSPKLSNEVNLSNEKKLRGPGRPRGQVKNPENDLKAELARNQCGKHSINSMSLMLNTSKKTLEKRIENGGNIISEKQGDCHFCDLKKQTDDISKDVLFPFMKFINEKNKTCVFQCSICDSKFQKRYNLFLHLKSIHQEEIKNNLASDIKPEVKSDCEDQSCMEKYGRFEGKKLWCTKCIELSLVPKSRRTKHEYMKKETSGKLCPECGKVLKKGSLKFHLDSVHYGTKKICPHCAKELPSERSLKDHIKKVHEKIPCAQCGGLYGSSVMGRHIRSAHTANDEKKFKCDICGKGFAFRQNFEEHKNVHTGEKPFKCKFCSACFASKGTHAMHQKGHLGHRRNSSKKEFF